MRYHTLPSLLALSLLLTFAGCVNQPLLLRNRPNVPPPLMAPVSQPVGDDGCDVAVVEAPVNTVSKPVPPPPVIKVPKLTYTVVKHDSFWKIARKFGVDTKELAACNNMSLKKPLKVGVVLVIPPGAVKGGKVKPFSSTWKTESVVKNKPLKKPSVAKPAEPLPSDGTYVVRPKDSIWKISRRFGLTTKKLVEANNLDPRKPIKPGMKLVIPGGGGDVAPSSTPVADSGVETASASNVGDAGSASMDESASADGAGKAVKTEKKDLLDDAVDSLDSKSANDKKDQVDSLLEGLDPNAVDYNTSSDVPGAPYKEDVMPNETLQQIADRYGITKEELLKANPNIKSDDDLKPFTSIIIPKK